MSGVFSGEVFSKICEGVLLQESTGVELIHVCSLVGPVQAQVLLEGQEQVEAGCMSWKTDV